MLDRFQHYFFSVRWIGHLIFFILFLLAAYYYKERLFADGAYYLLKIINYDRFAIEHGRFVAVAVQLLPWLAVKTGMSLKAVVMAYSLGDIFFNYLLFVFLVHILKDNAHGLLLLASIIIGVLFSFFCYTELNSGIGLTFVFLALLEKRKDRPSGSVLLLQAVLILTIVFSHPLLFIVLFILSVFFVISSRGDIHKVYLSHVPVFIIAVVLKYLTLDDYDGKKILYHIDPSNNAYKQLFSLTYMKEFIPFFLKDYWMVLIISAFTFLYYIFCRERLKALYCIASASAYVAFVVATHYAPYLSNYSERIYLPVVPIVLYPFVKDIASPGSVRFHGAAYTLLVVLIGLQIIYIFRFGSLYTKRIDLMMSWVSQVRDEPGRKFICDAATVNKFDIDAGWSVPAETLLYSSLEGRDKTKVIYLEDDLKAYLSDRSPMLYVRQRDAVVNGTVVNNRYFSDLNGPFKYLKN